MDAQTLAPTTPTAQPVQIDLIDDDGDDMRRVASTALSDAALTGSILRRGVLQAIGVRPNGDRYKIVFGRRRLRCARAAGLALIPTVVSHWTDGELRAVQAAENLQRQAPHTIDVWRTVCDLVDAGATIAEAAAEIGLDERGARRMERLGRLEPGLLKLVEIDMPNEGQLRVIANAATKVQRTALRGLGSKAAITGAGGRKIVAWSEIAARCKVVTIPRTRAIFDTTAHITMWSEDLFAQPDDPDRFTTTDVAKFMRLQEKALLERIETQRKARRRVEFAEYDTSKLSLKLPTGFRLVSVVPNSKPSRTECVFAGLRSDGTVMEVLAADVAAQRTADKQRERRAADRAKAQSPPETLATSGTKDHADDAPEGPEPPDAADDATGRQSVTKAGLEIIENAKTTAVCERLLLTVGDTDTPDLLRLVLLALLAQNVEINPYERALRIRSKLFRLLVPGGGLAPLSKDEIKGIAVDVLGELLIIGTRRGQSGAAAEWIGVAIAADEALPRFDTAAFLACVNGGALRSIATAAGLDGSGSVAALRERLTGQLPNWRPDAAQFGAPVPTFARTAA